MSEIENVQRKFIEEIQNNGMQHALEWIDGWYRELARATIQDELDGVKKAWSNQAVPDDLIHEGIEAIVAKRLLRISSVSGKSTSHGSNAMKEAEIVVLAEYLNGFGRRGRGASPSGIQAWISETNGKVEDSLNAFELTESKTPSL